MRRDELLSPWEPSAQDPFDLRQAGHLARRAALGLPLAERRRMVHKGLAWALQRVLEPGPGEDCDTTAADALALADAEQLRAHRVWRLLTGQQRVRERMSLFWHEHFATSIDKVQSARLMARQLALFDRLGLGAFDVLLLEVSRDPAMLLWLDSASNVKGHANENYARELFELFALGRGAYRERDVQEAARAFTGWHLRGEEFYFSRRHHDSGAKEVLGAKGTLGGEEVVALTVRRPESARFVAQKLLACFVHPEPLPDEIEALASEYTRCERRIGETLTTLLRSRLFFSARAYRARVKSPIDWTVGLVRSLGARAAPVALGHAAAKLGQALLAPPSVEGWHGERAWITSATWMLRANFAAELLAGRGSFGLAPSADELLADADTPAARADLAIKILLDGEVSDSGRAAVRACAASDAARGAGGAGALLHAVLTLPEAQLL